MEQEKEQEEKNVFEKAKDKIEETVDKFKDSDTEDNENHDEAEFNNNINEDTENEYHDLVNEKDEKDEKEVNGLEHVHEDGNDLEELEPVDVELDRFQGEGNVSPLEPVDTDNLDTTQTEGVEEDRELSDIEKESYEEPTEDLILDESRDTVQVEEVGGVEDKNNDFK